MNSILKIIKLFTPRERRRLVPLIIAVVIMSVLQVVGISSIGPFMAVASDPSVVESEPLLGAFYNSIGFETHQAFVIAVGIGAFLVMVGATAVKMGVNYAIFRYVANRRYSLGLRLFRQYLYQPYSYFLDHNSSELSKNLLSEVDQVVNNVLRPGMEAFGKIMITLAILVFLLVLNPWVALAAGGIFATIYGGLYLFVRNRLQRYGKQVREANLIRFKASSEAFGAIKDVKVMGKEPSFAMMYGSGAKKFANTQAAKQILSSLPSQAMQTLAMGFAIALVIVMLAIYGSISQILPLLAVYAFAIQKLLPNVKGVFKQLSTIRYYGHMVDSLYRDMTEMTAPPHIRDKRAMNEEPEPLPFENSIVLDDLSFMYPTSEEAVLRNIHLTIPKNTTVGFVGATGCGKTTIVDLIMGLLEPSSGQLCVDGQPIHSLRAWQRNFGYVPQHIYLSDDTVTANIAFGIPEDMRDLQAVERAARIAHLHDFVTNELPAGYDTRLGERGIRFSGGQRQRVGIARALYNDPDIIVMDEATSALDTVTEDAVMDAIVELMHEKTIILIAHRITTIKDCDQIVMLERGKIVARGDYQTLINTNERFRSMAKVEAKA